MINWDHTIPDASRNAKQTMSSQETIDLKVPNRIPEAKNISEDIGCEQCSY